MSLDYRLDGPEGSPVLVLSNSLGTTSELWDAQVASFERSFRVLRYDHPGHGRSAVRSEPFTVDELARGVLELLDLLKLDRVSFCGLSLGGMVGMALALEAPERIDRLALCCTSACLGPPEGWVARARLVRDEGMDAVVETVLQRWFTTDFTLRQPATVTQFREMLEATPVEGYARCCEAIATWDARAKIHDIQAPTLVIAGAEDPAIPREDAESLVRTIPKARMVVLPDAAHLANVEQPVAFNRALLEHLVARGTSEEAA